MSLQCLALSFERNGMKTTQNACNTPCMKMDLVVFTLHVVLGAGFLFHFPQSIRGLITILVYSQVIDSLETHDIVNSVLKLTPDLINLDKAAFQVHQQNCAQRNQNIELEASLFRF